MANVVGETSEPFIAGVSGQNSAPVEKAGPGVKGHSKATGVWGESDLWMGVYGHNPIGGAGVLGEGGASAGVIGTSTSWVGVYGETKDVENGTAGVWGEHKGGGTGVKAVSESGIGLVAYSQGNEAIHAETQSTGVAAIAAYNLNPDATGPALYAEKRGNSGHAGFFNGSVYITGSIHADNMMCNNADCAEYFEVDNSGSVEPGTVMVLGDEGSVCPSQRAYDKRVAGVISGAGDYKPAIILDKRHSDNQNAENRQPIALMGKVFCKVDATYGAIEVGDLLTTSPLPGHAMRVSDPLKVFGAVIGKALRPHRVGHGLIPMLIALQ